MSLLSGLKGKDFVQEQRKMSVITKQMSSKRDSKVIATGPCKTCLAKNLVCLWPCMVGLIEYHAANDVLVH